MDQPTDRPADRPTGQPKDLPRPATAPHPPHRPKVERFDLATRTNTDPKGLVRPVDRYRVEPYGLYLARPVPDHPTVVALRSWLLPGVGLRVTDYRFRPGHEPGWDLYVDVVAVEPGPLVWRTTDLYLDLLVRRGRGLEVLDADEFAAALGARLLDAATGERALTWLCAAVEGITGHGYSVRDWLATLDIVLTWDPPDR